MPKFLAPINGVPLCDILLDFLEAQKALPAIIALANGRELIISHLQNRSDVLFDLDCDQRGTAGAIRHAMLAKYREDIEFDESVFIVNGDTLFYAPLNSVKAFLKRSRFSWLTLMAGDTPVARLVLKEGLELIRNSSEPSLEKLLCIYQAFPIPRDAFVDIGTLDGYERAPGWVKSWL